MRYPHNQRCSLKQFVSIFNLKKTFYFSLFIIKKVIVPGAEEEGVAVACAVLAASAGRLRIQPPLLCFSISDNERLLRRGKASNMSDCSRQNMKNPGFWGVRLYGLNKDI